MDGKPRAEEAGCVGAAVGGAADAGEVAADDGEVFVQEVGAEEVEFGVLPAVAGASSEEEAFFESGVLGGGWFGVGGVGPREGGFAEPACGGAPGELDGAGEFGRGGEFLA